MKPLPLVSRLGAAGLALALAAGCAASTGDSSRTTGTATSTPPAMLAPSSQAAPTPDTTPSAAPSQAASPVWPYKSTWEISDVLFGEDGRVVVIETHRSAGQARITVLDENGIPVLGWPWTPSPTGDAAVGAVLGPEGSLYVTVRGQSGSPGARSHSLHRLAPDGSEMAGFPLDLPAVPFCSLAVADDAAVVSCGDEEVSDVVTARAWVVEPDGSTRDGWPVDLAVGAGIVGFGPDGRVYLQAWGEPRTITALARDGTAIAGWPHKVRAGDLVQVDGQGRIRTTSYRDGAEVQCGLPAKTVYTMLQADGSTGPGWPVSVSGWSSEPEITGDGTMVVAAATGLITGYSPEGEVKAGWPVRQVGVTVACSDGSRPWTAGDGSTLIVGEGRATLLDAAGKAVAGWPVALPYQAAESCPTCTPGPSAPMAPAVGVRAIYVGAYAKERPHVIVIARDGSMPKAAQVTIAKTGHWLQWVRIAPTGRVWALTYSYLEDGELGALYLVAQDTAPGS